MIALSLGAGVQSSTLLLIADRGEFGEKPEAAIFADTGWEPKAVYDHLDWLEANVSIPIVRVSVGNIRDDTLSGRLPSAIRAGDKGEGRWFATMPLYALDNGKKSLLRRQCTEEYKLKPIRRWLNRRKTELWIGISLDEVHRMRTSGVGYITNRYPLIDRRMSRHDCLRWLTANGFPIPPKSSCLGCPFKGNAQWRDLRDNSPAEWNDAVEFDRAIRTTPRLSGTTYLHNSLIPLDQVDLSTAKDHGQQEMFGNECEGMCGV